MRGLRGDLRSSGDVIGMYRRASAHAIIRCLYLCRVLCLGRFLYLIYRASRGAPLVTSGGFWMLQGSKDGPDYRCRELPPVLWCTAMHRTSLASADSFNFGRENQHFIKIYQYHLYLRGDMTRQLPELGMAHSSWHDQWVFTRGQVMDLCESYYVPRYEVEGNIIQNKVMAQNKEKRDMSLVLECVDWVMLQLARELPPARDVIKLRGEGKSFAQIMKLLPGRFYPSVVDDYTRFLRRLYGQREYEYLRRRI
jgi:hypothetical protein